MEIGKRKPGVSISRPVQPPPPPPPTLEQRSRIQSQTRPAPQDSDLLTRMYLHPAPLRRAPPPPIPPRANQASYDFLLPHQPQNRPTDGGPPGPSLAKSTQSFPMSISSVKIKTSAPVSVVRPYNFAPTPTQMAVKPEAQSSESYLMKPALSSHPCKSPDEAPFFASFKDPAQQICRSTSPSFLDELQQAFPLLRQENRSPRSVAGHPRCGSLGWSKCKKDKDDLFDSNSELETYNDPHCLPLATAVIIADDLSEVASPLGKVNSQQPNQCPSPPTLTFQQSASVPDTKNNHLDPTIGEKPITSCYPQLSRHPTFSTTAASSVCNNSVNSHNMEGEESVQHPTHVRPVLKSSSMKESKSRSEVPVSTLPSRPAPRLRPPLPPRPQSFLLPDAPPLPPRRRESLLVEVRKHSKLGKVSQKKYGKVW